MLDFGIFILFAFLCLTLLGLFVLGILLWGKPNPILRITWGIAVAGNCLFLFAAGWIIRRIDLDESLWSAAANGDVPTAERLIGSGASPNAKWEDGSSALDVARENRQTEMVRFLISKGAK